MPTIENCEEKVQLLQEYQIASEAYALSVSDLSKKIGVASRVEYQQLRDSAATCRYHSAAARDRLDRHIAQHGC